jgi:UDP-2,4-diacetamido-2,4,6-trideoxy-beta-L-altropyranose hydrolase
MKKIGLLFNSKPEIGGGHFWRCFNLAKSLKNQNLEFVFISNFLNIDFIKILKKENFKYLKQLQINDAKYIIPKINKYKLDILITDNYDLKYKEKKRIRKCIKLLVVIDDFINKRHDSDVYINNNFLNKLEIKKIKKLNPDSKLFLGPKYSILDSSFYSLKKNININKKRIFCFFGSTDSSNETLKFLNAMHGKKNVILDILIGRLNKNYKNLKKKFNYKKDINFHYNLPNKKIYSIINRSNISIGSGGINMLERLFLGIPSIVICVADNQKKSIVNLVKKKFIIYLGNAAKVSKENIEESIENLIKNEKKIINLSKKLDLYFNKIKTVYLLSIKLSLIIKNLKI